MFVLQKQLSVMNLPSSRVAKIYRSGTDVQLALPDLPTQMASAYLVMLQGAGKVQVLVGLYLAESCRSIFYLSDVGEVAADQADQELEAGLDFAESMGFVLDDIEFDRLPEDEQEAYWKGLPICRRQTRQTAPVAPADDRPQHVEEQAENDSKTVVVSPAPEREEPAAVVEAAPEKAQTRTRTDSEGTDKVDIESKRQVFKELLGRFLASL